MVRERLYDGVKKISEFEHSGLKAAIASDAIIAAATAESSNLRIPAKDIDTLATERANAASGAAEEKLRGELAAKAEALQADISARALDSEFKQTKKDLEAADVVINSRIDSIVGTDVIALSNRVDAHIEDDNRHITEALLGHIDSKADQSELETLSNGIDGIKDILGKNEVVTEVTAVNAEDSLGTLKVRAELTNLTDGNKRYADFPVPIADLSNCGSMSPDMLAALQEAQRNINNLLAQVMGLPRTAVVAGLGNEPTPNELTAAFAEAMDGQPRANDRLVNVDSKTEFIFDTEEVWRPLSGETIGLATEENPGYVQSSESGDGTVSYPTAGIGRVNGWGTLDARVSTNAANIELRQRKSTANYQMGKSDGTWEEMTTAQKSALNSGLAAADKTKIATLETNLALKQDKLNRTITCNADGTTAITDNGENLSIPLPVTVAKGTASATLTTAGTRSLGAQLKILIDNMEAAVMAAGTVTQSIGGVKTFTSAPLCGVTPTTNDQLTRKAYVDSRIVAYAAANEAAAKTDSGNNPTVLMVVKET